MQHGKPHYEIGRVDQPVAREGQAGRSGVTERSIGARSGDQLLGAGVGGGLGRNRGCPWRFAGSLYYLSNCGRYGEAENGRLFRGQHSSGAVKT